MPFRGKRANFGETRKVLAYSDDRPDASRVGLFNVVKQKINFLIYFITNLLQ